MKVINMENSYLDDVDVSFVTHYILIYINMSVSFLGKIKLYCSKSTIKKTLH